jgi:hypothetical protein
LALALTKPNLTLDFKNSGDAYTTARLEFVVKVKKLTIQRFCQTFANRGLASTHHPDQKDRGVVCPGALKGRQSLCRICGSESATIRRFGGRSVIHSVIITLTASHPKLGGANPPKTIKIASNEQI